MKERSMFKVRKIKATDFEQLKNIKKQLDISDDYLTQKDTVAMVMIEEGDYKGFVSYKIIDDMSFVIDHLYTTQVFTDNTYKDLLLRSLLNYGLMHGKVVAYALANTTDNFYESYDFDQISKQKVKEYNKLLTNHYDLGYRINITEFFNRPCES